MTPEDAERYILSRELFGMRFGLDRMRRLMTAMGNPQLRFQSIHVVGTNGKSSTVRMTAAILAKHGLRTGAYLSPHLVSFAERIRVDDEDLTPEEFAAAIQRAARAAELVDRSLVGDDRVTQFELLTAAAYSELARRGVEVAVIEAAERGATIVHAGADPGVPLIALGPYQRRNFALARATAEAYLGELDPDAVAAAAAEILVPGRLQAIGEHPLTLLDGAHNPDGIAALAEALAEPWAAGHDRVVAVISILDDKDAAGMLSQLLPLCDALVLTASQNPRALPPPTLQSLASQLGGPPSEVIRDPRAALERARELAGPNGLVVATGSIYLVADLLRPVGAGRASML